MEQEGLNIAQNFYGQWGAVAILVGLLVYGLVISMKRHEQKDAMHKEEREAMEKEHRDEREQSMAQYSKQHDQLVDVTKDTHTILTEIKTLISTRDNH